MVLKFCGKKWKGVVVKKEGQKKVFVDLTNIGVILKFCEEKKKIMRRSGCLEREAEEEGLRGPTKFGMV